MDRYFLKVLNSTLNTMVCEEVRILMKNCYRVRQLTEGVRVQHDATLGASPLER